MKSVAAIGQDAIINKTLFIRGTSFTWSKP
jgi:hypothetical protein